MPNSIPAPNNIKDTATRRAIIGLSKDKPINHANITDLAVRRVVIALDQRRKGENIDIPSPAAIKDKNIRRILEKLI